MQKIQTSGGARTQGDSKYKERGNVAMSISINSETDKGTARLAQSAERKALNLVVVGPSPTVGAVVQKHKNLKQNLPCLD